MAAPGNQRLAALNHRVAAAADAWLLDPRDTGVYARLIAAVEARRGFLNPTLADRYIDGDLVGDADGPTEEAQSSLPPKRHRDSSEVAAEIVSPVGDTQDAELLDELGAHTPPRPIGETLHGDPQTVLARLRGPDATPDDQP